MHTEDKTAALVLQSLMFSVNGFWVASVLGYIMQQACVMSRGGLTSKSCLLYDNNKLRHTFVSFGFASRCFAVTFVFATWFFVVREEKLQGELRRNQENSLEDMQQHMASHFYMYCLHGHLQIYCYYTVCA